MGTSYTRRTGAAAGHRQDGRVVLSVVNGEEATPGKTARRRDRTRGRWSVTEVLSFSALCGVLAMLAWHIGVRTGSFAVGSPTAVYTVTVGSYVLSRFVLAALYRPPAASAAEPMVAIVIPAFNEGRGIARTIEACRRIEYPPAKLEVVVVNDGSTDDTPEHMHAAAAAWPLVSCIDLPVNRGKRAAMAAGLRATTAEIVLFLDSDSAPKPDGVRTIVRGFDDPRVGAVSGQTRAHNAETNMLTRMQAARYLVSFQLLKAAESAVGAVACCSGCFAAYRRAALTPELVQRWERQRFLGRVCTYGDDRALTNMVIRDGWTTIYDAHARAHTQVPDSYGVFFRQQLRWKKSWAREGPLLLAHVWRTRPLAFPFVAVNTLAGFVSPAVVVYNLIVVPFHHGLAPIVYVLGLYLVALAYALLHRAVSDDGLWVYAVIGTAFYVSFCIQLYWALLRLRDGAWGTREVSVATTETSHVRRRRLVVRRAG